MDGLNWSPQQEKALRAAEAWLKDPTRQVFYLAGLAGTGKSTLAKHLVQEVQGPVYYGAFTGKAALVMQRAGCEGATTIHRLIYQPREKSRARLRELLAQRDDAEQEGAEALQILDEEITREENELRRPTFEINPESTLWNADLVVIDECSMVTERMAQDLLSFRVKVLVLGDPAQLPPPRGAGYFTNAEPDIMLTEIHRQALDNPIIALAARVRERKKLKIGKYGDSEILPLGKFDPLSALEFDQLIVGTHKTRHKANRFMRHHLFGPDAAPIALADKLLCLRNNHKLGLLNGSLWEVDAFRWDDDVGVYVADLSGDNGAVYDVPIFREPFEGKKVPFWMRKLGVEFEHGYAMTCHKAQGSQWPTVVVRNEAGKFNCPWQWLYSSITRASERLTLVV